jgi:hypothetical protein
MGINIKLYILVFAFLVGCKKDPEPRKPTALERPYLRKLTVEGAKEVTLDHSARTIQIVLPETYESDEIELQMELIDGVSVSSTDPVKTYGFRGFRPIPLHILNNYSQQYDTYTIYVAVEGEIEAHLWEDLYLTENGSCEAVVVFTSGMGTVPERPSESDAMSAWLGDAKNGKPSIKNTGSNLFQFADAYKLVPSESLDLTIIYKEQKYQFPKKEKLTKWFVRASIDSLPSWWSRLPKSASLNIEGGCFMPQKKYQIKLQNDSENVRAIAAEYKGTQRLSFKIPDDVKDGNYYLGLYEGNELISKSIYTISNDTRTKGIQQVWSEYAEEVTPIALDAGTFESIISAAGKEIYVNPFPMFTRAFTQGAITEDQLPSLRLIGNGTTHELAPKIREDRHFGDSALVLYYASYKLPQHLAPGKYTIQLNYKDSGVTGPFCKQLEIR